MEEGDAMSRKGNEGWAVCKERNDFEAAEISVRIHGNLSDLHAADTQYHGG